MPPASRARPGHPPPQVSLADLLARIKAGLEATAALVLEHETAMGVLIGQAHGLPPKVIQDLQDIDLIYQRLQDLATVLGLAAQATGAQVIDRAPLEHAIRLREMARLLLPGPETQSPSHPTDGHVSWF